MTQLVGFRGQSAELTTEAGRRGDNLGIGIPHLDFWKLKNY
jgi:hypothetical protein